MNRILLYSSTLCNTVSILQSIGVCQGLLAPVTDVISARMLQLNDLSLYNDFV